MNKGGRVLAANHASSCSTVAEERKGRALLDLYAGSTEILTQRELINAGSDKRFARRDEKGQFKESDDQGSSLCRDPRQHAKHNPKVSLESRDAC